MDIKELSLEEKIGQMIIIGMDSNYITERIKNMILEYKIGGIILYRKNFKTYQEMLELIRELKNLNKKNKISLFIAIDQEGGRVNRMPKELKNLPSANQIAEKGGEELVRKSAEITGRILRKSGYNLNFAPVLDIKRFGEKTAIGDRSFSEDKEKVSRCGIATMEELQKNQVISVIKHFPGHGATKQDSHHFLPIIKSSMKKIENEDMYPFKKAIEKGADAVLVGHLLIRKETGIYPASLSRKFIIKHLRKKYRYNGLIITDDLKMKAIKFFYGPYLATKKAFEAGNDIIVFRFNAEEEKRVIDQIIKTVKSDNKKQCRVNRSVKRIIEIKQKYQISDTEEIKGVDIEKINSEIAEIRKKCGLEDY